MINSESQNIIEKDEKRIDLLVKKTQMTKGLSEAEQIYS